MIGTPTWPAESPTIHPFCADVNCIGPGPGGSGSVFHVRPPSDVAVSAFARDFVWAKRHKIQPWLASEKNMSVGDMSVIELTIGRCNKTVRQLFPPSSV